MRRIRTLAAVAAAALSIGAGPASAAHIDGRPTSAIVHQGAGAVTALSVVPGDGRADVVIALNGPVKVAHFIIPAPDRIVLDLTGARLNPLRAYDRRLRAGIRNVRISNYSPGVVRVVLDLDAKRQYTVTQSDSEIRVSMTGGEQFVAWHSSGDRTVFADAAPAAPRQEPTANVATGSLAPAPAPVVAPPPAAVPPAPVNTPPPAAVTPLPAVVTPPPAVVTPPPAVVTPPPAVVTPPPAAERPDPVREIIASAPPRVTPIVQFGGQQSQARRISITWEDAPIADVLATFAEIGGRTIVRGKAVTGTISAEIKDQPWDVAMKAILDAHGLAATEENSGIIVVDSYENILARQSSEPLRIEMVNINYASAGSLVGTVSGLLSKDCAGVGAGAQATQGPAGQGACITRGSVAADSGTNSLIITEVNSRIAGLLQYIRQLDVRTPQVALKAKIISVSRTSIEQLGISYDLGSNAAYFNNLVPRNRPGSDAADDREGRVTLGGEVLAGMGNASRKYKNGSALNLLFSTALGKYSLTAFLDALREQQLSDIQAEPSIVTLDNREAKILVGEETPVRVIDAGAASQVAVPARANVQFKETGIILTVTPHITNNRQIRMSISAEQSELRIIGGDLGFTIPKRNATTQLLVNDGETAVIGGLTQTQITKNKSGIPLLSDLPLIGRLFSQTDSREEKRDLLILITPHIIDEGEAIRPPDNNDQR